MADLWLSTNLTPPLAAPWQLVAESASWHLSSDELAGPHPLAVVCSEEAVVAILGTGGRGIAKDMLKEAGALYDDWSEPEALRRLERLVALPVSGVIFWPRRDAVCVFRDKFGVMPWMVHVSPEGGLSMTSSPERHAAVAVQAPLDETWFGRFLWGIDAASRDDCFLGSERLRAGESLWLRDGRATYQRYWRPSDAPNRSLAKDHAAQLREALFSAVSRIPDDLPLVFTLSGGLDSSGILATYCSGLARGTHVNAVSLVSARHPSCDESRELDILEKAFPIRLTRISMDDVWTLREPDLYRQCLHGPLVAPGIETSLAVYRAMREVHGPCRIITGYGGNFLVKVRREALWRDLLSRRAWPALVRELTHTRPHQARELLARVIANSADGKLLDTLKRILPAPLQQVIFRPHQSVADPKTWLCCDFVRRHGPESVDPIFSMTHAQERDFLPVSWEWEMRARALDWVARIGGVTLYDPLFDPELYALCAHFPPGDFLRHGDWRYLYKETLRPLLPRTILTHPKCQTFDAIVHEGIAMRARPVVESAIAHLPHTQAGTMIDAQALARSYARYAEAVARYGEALPFRSDLLWRAISTALWGQ
ncbi:MAG: asparagine synthase-related protein [Proteobacteria bacterium]|nr:asparagine synthase-related protein [Pseudomonadota bacterium]